MSGGVGGWVGGWLEIWEVKLISTQVVVEVEVWVEFGKNNKNTNLKDLVYAERKAVEY